jgi:chitodextrinase
MKKIILIITSAVIVLAVGWGILASYKKPMPAAIVNPPTADRALQQPRNLKVSPVSDTQANLSWLAPADIKGVVGYIVFRDGQKIGTTLKTIFSDSTYTSSTNHSYRVASYNSQGTLSAFSNVVAVPMKTATANPPPPPATACGSGGACSAAEVALHHTQADCWVYLSPIDKVYNITAFVANPNTHPGGNVIIPHCGTNIYSYFIGSAGGHVHSNNARSILDSYYIGPFQP